MGLRVLQEVLTGLGLGQRAGEAAKQQKKFICQWICVSEQYLGEYWPIFSRNSSEKACEKNRYMHNTNGNWAEPEQSCSLGSAKQRDRDNVSFGVGSNQVQAAGLGALLTLERNRLSSPAKAIPQHSLQDWHNHAKCWSGIPAPQRKLQHPKETAWKGWALFSYIQFFYRTLVSSLVFDIMGDLTHTPCS